MVFYFASPKYNPLINKVLTETDQVIAESIVGNDLFLKKTMKDKLASIASIDIIIVDFTALADTDAEIMEAVLRLCRQLIEKVTIEREIMCHCTYRIIRLQYMR